jgi:hypothetical protein
MKHWQKLTVIGRLRISAKHPEIPLCVAGDFNQTRDSQKGGYGTIDARSLWTSHILLDTFNSYNVTSNEGC